MYSLGRMKLFSLLSALLSLGVNAFGNGVDTCISVPQHGMWAMGCNPNNCFPVGTGAGGALGGSVAYMIDVIDNTNTHITSYVPNTQYNAVLRNTNSSTNPCTATTCFRGFVLTAGAGRINGNFAATAAASNSSAGVINIDPFEVFVRRMTNCNGITHVSNNYIRRINFLWTSPPTGSGPVTFKSVIVGSRTASNYVATLILNEAIPVLQNITISISPSVSFSSSTSQSSSVSRTTRPSRSPSITSSNTHSNTASITMGVAPSMSSSISYSSSITPTSSVSVSLTSSITQSVVSTPSNTDTPLETDTRTPSLTPNMLPSYSSSPSQTNSQSPSNTQSHTASYSMDPSISIGSTPSRTALPSPSMIVSDSTTPTYSPTLGASHSATQTNDPNFITIVTNSEPSQTQTMGTMGLGAAIGIIVTITVIGALYVIHKRNMKRSRPHSMRSVIFMKDSNEHVASNPSFGIDVGEPTQPKSPQSQYTRAKFDPISVHA